VTDKSNDISGLPSEELDIRETKAWQVCYEEMENMKENSIALHLWLTLNKVIDKRYNEESVKLKLQQFPEMENFIEKCMTSNIVIAVANHYAKHANDLQMDIPEFFSNMDAAYSKFLADSDPQKEIGNLRLEISGNRLKIEELTKSLGQAEQSVKIIGEKNDILNKSNTELQTMLERSQELEAELQGVLKRKEELEQDLATVEKEQAWQAQQLEQAAAQLEEAQIRITELYSLLTKADENTEQITEKREAKLAQDTAEKLEEAEQRIIDAESKVEELESYLSRAGNKIEELEGERETDKNNLQKAKTNITDINFSLINTAKRANTAEQRTSDLEKQLAEANQNKSDQDKEIEFLSQQNDKKQRRINELQKKIVKLQQASDEKQRVEYVLSPEDIIAQMPVTEELDMLKGKPLNVKENNHVRLFNALSSNKITVENNAVVTIDILFPNVNIQLDENNSFVVINKTSKNCQDNPVEIIVIGKEKEGFDPVILGSKALKEHISVLYLG
jgi:DNA repair exonuclease SbcCD ATPase subunit